MPENYNHSLSSDSDSSDSENFDGEVLSKEQFEKINADRVRIYKAHLEVVQWALESKFTEETLRKKIDALEPLEYSYYDPKFQGNPQIGGKNLFNIILNHAEFSVQTKHALIGRLVLLKYDRYYAEILNDLVNPEIALDFIAFDMRIRSSADSILALHHWIQYHIKGSAIYENYSSIFTKMAQIYILEMVKNQRVLLSAEQERFVASTKPLLFHCFKKHDSSHDIYEMLFSDKTYAENRFNKKCEKEEQMINHKLERLLRHKTHFKFFDKEQGVTSQADPKEKLALSRSVS